MAGRRSTFLADGRPPPAGPPRLEDGVWLVTRFTDAVEVLGNWQDFRQLDGAEVLGAPGGRPGPQVLVFADPPDHTRHRRLMTSGWSMKEQAERHRPAVAIAADERLAALEDGDGFDLMADYAVPLVTRVVGRVIGFDPAVWGEVRGTRGDPERHAEARRRFLVHARDRLVEVRARPDGCWLSAIIAAGDESLPPFGAEELRRIVEQLDAASIDTTAGTIGHAVLAVLAAPDRGGTEWPAVVEEALRSEPVIRALPRRVAHDATVGGVALPAGARVLVVLGSANQDPARFPDPDRFDPGRDNLRAHIGLGRGVHSCVGAPLARVVVAVAVERLFTRLPGLTLDGPPAMRPMPELHGPVTLRVRMSS